jgi:hypothetical protein
MKKSLILLTLGMILCVSGYSQQKRRGTSTISKKATEKKRLETTSDNTATQAVVTQQQPSAPTKSKQPSQAPTTYLPTKVRRSYAYGYNRGDKLLNLGVGLSSYYYGTPIGLSYESGVGDDVSFGAQFDYNSGNYDGYYNSNYRWGYSAYYAGIRGSYHFNRALGINDKDIDLYAGVGLGYQRFRWDDDSYGYGYGYSYNYRSGLFFNYFIGGKYYFSEKIGAFVELGYTGLSSSRVGLSVKF